MRSPLGLVLVVALISCGCSSEGGSGTGEDPRNPPVDDPARNARAATDDPLGESVKKVVYLDQGWSASDSLRFYFTPQGSQIIPYDWFLALEQADSEAPFRNAENMLRFRYLPQSTGPMNPDGLPVGFVRDDGVDRAWLGLTCAACHTTEIHHEGTAYRIDGAPTMGDVRALLSALIESLQKTHGDDAKFDRFAAKVLGGRDYAVGPGASEASDGRVDQDASRLQHPQLPRLRPDQADAAARRLRPARRPGGDRQRGVPLRREGGRRADLEAGRRPGQLSVPLGHADAEPGAVGRHRERRPVRDVQPVAATSARCSASSAAWRSPRGRPSSATARPSGFASFARWRTGSRRSSRPSGPPPSRRSTRPPPTRERRYIRPSASIATR